MAAADAMLQAVYRLLAEGATHRDPGPDQYDRRHAQRLTRRAIQLL
jgi:hypothetical protein